MNVQSEQAPVVGLTAAEAEARRRRARRTRAVGGTSRSYATILRTNVFSFYNTILFVIGAALLALGRYSDALISVGLGLVNAVISAVQEIRAKRKLDRLQLLDRAPVLVVRDGREVEVAPDAVVRGDVLRVRPGDQIVVDGPLLDGRVEADESLLTGESDPVVKDPGDELRSGSLCVAGGGHQLARDVGAASYAGRLTAEARRVTTDTTPLQRRIEFVVRLVMALTVLMSGAILAQAALEGFTLLRVVQTTAVLSGLVPYGLFFLIAVAYTAGAATIAGRGALVQQVNAVESVSNVDVVCTDKTGTLTTGRLTLDEVEPLGGRDPREVEAVLGALARSATTPNLTTAALAAACPARAWTVRDEVPFSLVAALVGRHHRRRHVGARRPGRPRPPPRRARCPRTPWPSAPARGLRVLVLARATGPSAGLRDGAGRPALPALEPVAVVALADELRPEVAETISRLPRRRGRAQGALRRRPAHRRRARHPGRPGRRRAGARRRARRPRRRGPGPARRPHHRVRPRRPRAQGTDRRLAAPPGPLRRDDRRRGQRRPRAQGRPRRGGHAQRQRGHPRRRRHRARRRLLRRAAARPARGPADHQRHRRVDVRLPGAGRHPGPGDPRGDHARAGLPLLPHPGRADPAHRRRPDPVPHLLGPARAARPAPAGQPRPLRHPRRGDHRRIRHRRLRPPLPEGHRGRQLGPHHRRR